MDVHDDEFSQYVSTHRPALRRFAFRLAADWYEADDLVQRTLIALHARWEGLDHRDKIAAYTHTVMVRLFISDRRSRRWSHEILHEWPPEPEPVYDAGASSFDDRLLLLSALRSLAPRQRAVVLLRYWDDRSVEETAQALGCVGSTVRSQTARAMATLRSMLEPDLRHRN